MSTIRSRLQRLTATPEPAAHAFEVWWQAADGDDAFTTDAHPGVTLTAAELDTRPIPRFRRRLIVHYAITTAPRTDA